MGLDPNRWFGNVEKAMALLSKPEMAKKARYGYCRCEDPVNYVSQIQNRYDHYVQIVPMYNVAKRRYWKPLHSRSKRSYTASRPVTPRGRLLEIFLEGLKPPSIWRHDGVMKQTLALASAAILIISLALNGCSTATPIVSEWRNPAQASGSFQRLMIAGPNGDATVRRNFEDEFVAQLAPMGVDAVPSYRFIPESGEAMSENILKQAAQEARVDGLLLMRPAKIEEKINYPTPAPPISFGIFGSNAGAEWYGIPGMASGPYRYNEYTSETVLYDVTRNDLAWTGMVTAKEPANLQTAIKSYVETVTKALAAQNLLPKK